MTRFEVMKLKQMWGSDATTYKQISRFDIEYKQMSRFEVMTLKQVWRSDGT